MLKFLLSFMSTIAVFGFLIAPLSDAYAGDTKGTWNKYPYHSPSKPYQLHQDFKIPDPDQK